MITFFKKAMASVLSSAIALLSISAMPAVFADDTGYPDDSPVTEDTFSGMTDDGCTWFYWNESNIGTAEMNTENNGRYTFEWNDTHNVMCGVGEKLTLNTEWKNLGKINYHYNAEFEAQGNSHLELYGNFIMPDIEFHICENYSSWRPPGDGFVYRGTAEIDGGEYEIYQSRIISSTIPLEMPMQIWSVRKEDDLRSSGVISLDKQFAAMEDVCGIKLKNLYNGNYSEPC